MCNGFVRAVWPEETQPKLDQSDAAFQSDRRQAVAWALADMLDKLAMVDLAARIGLLEGIGDKLAEGPARFAAQLGPPELSMTVKGQSIAAYDPRGMKAMDLGYAMN